MRGRYRRYMAFEQVGQNGTRQGRTLAWIGSCSQFIEQDQEARSMFLQLLEQFIRHLASNVGRGLTLLFINTPQNLDDAAQVRREGTQTLLDTLLISNISKDFLKNSYFRTLIHRNM